MSKPKLLFLCQTLPYPPDGGVSIRTFNVIRQLAKEYEIHLLCFYRKRTTRDLASSLEVLRTHVASADAFEIPQERSRLRFAADHLASVFSLSVYTRHVYRSKSFIDRLSDLLRRNEYALVHVDSLDLSAFLPLLEDRPVVCTHHNVESILLARRARLSSNPLVRWYLALQAELMRREEHAWAGKVALNLVCSGEDAGQLRQIAPDAQVHVVPNGVDAGEFVPFGSLDGRIVFLGGTSWYPNKDALKYYDREIWPSMKSLGMTDPVLWVGRASDDDRKTTDPSSVEFTGYVDDIRPVVGAASCFIVPLRVGGGTRLKILTAWSLGLPVVSTSVGCEGLSAVDGVNILIRDNPKEFAGAVKNVRESAELRASLSRNGRATVEAYYDWEIIGKDLRLRLREHLSQR